MKYEMPEEKIENHIEFNKIQNILLKNNFSCNLKLNIITGEITI